MTGAAAALLLLHKLKQDKERQEREDAIKRCEAVEAAYRKGPSQTNLIINTARIMACNSPVVLRHMEVRPPRKETK